MSDLSGMMEKKASMGLSHFFKKNRAVLFGCGAVSLGLILTAYGIHTLLYFNEIYGFLPSYWMIYILWMISSVVTMFSSFAIHADLPLHKLLFHPCIRIPFDWAAWTAVLSYVLLYLRKNKSTGGPINNRLEEIIKIRLKTFGLSCLFSLGCLLFAGTLAVLVAWFAPDQVLGGRSGWAAVGHVMEEGLDFKIWWITVILFIAWGLVIVAGFNIWYAIFFALTGRDLGSQYKCPHCFETVDAVLPEVGENFTCPKCKQGIRRGHW